MIPYPLVCVEWLDHYELGPDWAEINDLTPQIAVCFSVGWVLAETDEILTLCPHLSLDPDDDDPTGTSSQLNIVKGAIRRMSFLSFPEKK